MEKTENVCPKKFFSAIITYFPIFYEQQSSDADEQQLSSEALSMFVLKNGLDGLLYPECTRAQWDQTIDQLIFCGRVKACLGLFGGLILLAFLSVGILQNQKNRQRMVQVTALCVTFFLGCVITMTYVNLSASRCCTGHVQ